MAESLRAFVDLAHEIFFRNRAKASLYVRGEAGIGKTRLIDEVQRAAMEAGFVCHAALVLDFGGGAGRDAIRALARSLLTLEVTSDPGVTRAAAAAALASDLVARDDAVFLNDMLDLPQPPELRGLYVDWRVDHETRPGSIEAHRRYSSLLTRRWREVDSNHRSPSRAVGAEINRAKYGCLSARPRVRGRAPPGKTQHLPRELSVRPTRV